jgi:hypothetical protein
MVNPEAWVIGVMSSKNKYINSSCGKLSEREFIEAREVLSKNAIDVYGEANLEGVRIYKLPEYPSSVITLEFSPRKERIQIGSSNLEEAITLSLQTQFLFSKFCNSSIKVTFKISIIS